MGYGRILLYSVFNDYKGKILNLHVSGQNIPAMKMYENLGFTIKESLIYYTFKWVLAEFTISIVRLVPRRLAPALIMETAVS